MTKEQNEILAEVKKILDNELNKKIGIVATAGSGKTFTLAKIAEDNPDKQFLYLVFNKEAKLDAQKRFPKNTKVSTLHALAFRGIFPYGLQGKEILPRYQDFILEAIEHKLDKDVNLKKIAYNFSNKLRDIDFNLDEDKTYSVIWQAIKEGDIEYTHDAYLREFIENEVVVNKLTSHYDAVFIDEAQDLNPMTFGMLKKITKTQIFVGDPNQAIYAFNDCINIFNELKFDKMFHLSETFRCVSDIVDKANILLNKIGRKDTKEMVTNVVSRKVETTAILTRTNAGMVKYLVSSMRAGKKLPYIVKDPKVLFEDIFQFYDFAEVMIANNKFIAEDKRLKEVRGSFFANRENFQDLCGNLNKYTAKKSNDFWLSSFYTLEEFEDYVESSLNTKDKPSMLALKKIVTSIERKEIEKLFHMINNSVYSDKNQKILTAHISKGLEYDKVIVYDDFVDFFEIDKQIKEQNKIISDLEKSVNSSTDKIKIAQINSAKKNREEIKQKRIEELNLLYVAITRAKYSLKFLDKNLEQYCCEK